MEISPVALYFLENPARTSACPSSKPFEDTRERASLTESHTPPDIALLNMPALPKSARE